MDEQFAVPDWGVDELIASDPETYISQWKELMRDGDCVIAIQFRKANAIGRAMYSHGFSNEQVWKAYNIARVACGLTEKEMPTKPMVSFPLHHHVYIDGYCSCGHYIDRNKV